MRPLTPSAIAAGLTDFAFATDTTAVFCGSILDFDLAITYTGGSSSDRFSIRLHMQGTSVENAHVGVSSFYAGKVIEEGSRTRCAA